MKIYNKYKIEHTDGTPLKGKKYFVMRLDSDDHIEAARVARAMRAYEGKLRNCDVGTQEEQLDRYGVYCQNRCTSCDNRHYCHICGERYRMKCMMEWAQMHYKAEKGEADSAKDRAVAGGDAAGMGNGGEAGEP